MRHFAPPKNCLVQRTLLHSFPHEHERAYSMLVIVCSRMAEVIRHGAEALRPVTSSRNSGLVFASLVTFA